MVTAYRPEKLSDILDVRRTHGALPFAGGTDLMVRYRRGTGALPDIDGPVVFLDKCSELKGIEQNAGYLKIGAAVTYAELLAHRSAHPALAEICVQIGAPGLRNIATVGGNICNASPAADTLPFLYAFDASVELRSAGGSRRVPIGDFITGPGATDLKPDEILVSILVPVWDPTVWRYRKVGTRKANALTKVSFAGFADIEDLKVTRVAITFGAVGPKVIRARLLEKELTGAEVSQVGRDLPRLLSLCGEATSPIDDQRSTAAYRRKVAVNLFRRFLIQDVSGGKI